MSAIFQQVFFQHKRTIRFGYGYIDILYKKRRFMLTYGCLSTQLPCFYCYLVWNYFYYYVPVGFRNFFLTAKIVNSDVCSCCEGLSVAFVVFASSFNRVLSECATIVGFDSILMLYLYRLHISMHLYVIYMKLSNANNNYRLTLLGLPKPEV